MSKALHKSTDFRSKSTLNRANTVADQANDADVIVKHLYRENADLRIRNELLEQSLKDNDSGVLWDKRILNDYQEMAKKVASLQQVIEEQSDMLDEAQEIMQQMKNEKEILQDHMQSFRQESHNTNSYILQLQAAMEREASANKVIAILQQQLETSQSSVLPYVQEVSDEEENYSVIHEEIELVTHWLDRIDGLLFDGKENPDILVTLENRMDRVFQWCQNHMKEPEEIKTAPIDTQIVDPSHRTLIEALFSLVEGRKATSSSLILLQSMHQSISQFLSPIKAKSLSIIRPTDWSIDYSEFSIPIITFGQEHDMSFTENLHEPRSSLLSLINQCISYSRDTIRKNSLIHEQSIRSFNNSINEKDRVITSLRYDKDRLRHLTSCDRVQFDKLLLLYRELEEKYTDDMMKQKESNLNTKKENEMLKEKGARCVDEIIRLREQMKQFRKERESMSMRFVF